MKKIQMIIGLSGMVLTGYAQKMTLEESIQTALTNRSEVKNAQLEIQVAQGENDRLKAQWLPQVRGAADVRWNTQLQTSVFKNAPFANGQDVRLVLGVPFNTTVGINAEQKIVDASAKYDRQLNAAKVEDQQIAREKTKIDLRQAVTEAYYAVLFNAEKVQLAQRALERAQAYQLAGRTKFDKGTLLANELDRLRLDVNNAQTSLKKAQTDQALSLENLVYQMGLAAGSPVQLADSLPSLFEKTIRTVSQESLERRPEILQEKNALKINELNEKKQSSRWLPLVSAYGSYTALQLNDVFNPFTAGTWFPYSYLGVKLEIPIFDGRQASLRKRDYAIQASINRNNLKQLDADFAYEIRSTATALAQEKDNLNDTRANLELARQILETDRLRYEKGVLLLSDLKNSEYSLQNAETNYLSSIYNFLLASLRYQKAAGGL